MRCPSCGTDLGETDAAFCPRCGDPLGSSEAEVTGRIEVEPRSGEGSAGHTTELRTDGTDAAPQESESPVRPRLRGALSAAGKSVWTDAAAAGGLSFLFLLCVGGVLLLAAKLQYPSFGADADPIETFSAIVILSLGILKAPIHIGKLTLSALPMGALAAVAWGILWSNRGVTKRHPAAATRERVTAGIRMGIVFGLLCLVAALVFRFRGKDPVYAGAVGASLLGLFWGCLFGALAGFLEPASARERVGALSRRLRARSQTLYTGVGTASVAMVVASVLAAGAALIWIIVRLISSGTPANFGAGDALAALVYLGAFAPNIIVSVITLSLGAPVDAGAQITLGGRTIGKLSSYSLFDWSGGAPLVVFLLILIPIAAGVVGGIWARYRVERDNQAIESFSIAAVTFGLVMFVLSAMADARLGAGLVRSKGFGLIAPDPWLTMSLAVTWIGLVGFLSWRFLSPRLGAAKRKDERA